MKRYRLTLILNAEWNEQGEFVPTADLHFEATGPGAILSRQRERDLLAWAAAAIRHEQQEDDSGDE